MKQMPKGNGMYRRLSRGQSREEKRTGNRRRQGQSPCKVTGLTPMEEKGRKDEGCGTTVWLSSCRPARIPCRVEDPHDGQKWPGLRTNSSHTHGPGAAPEDTSYPGAQIWRCGTQGRPAAASCAEGGLLSSTAVTTTLWAPQTHFSTCLGSFLWLLWA